MATHSEAAPSNKRKKMTNLLTALGKYQKREEKRCKLHKRTSVLKLKSLNTRINGCDQNLSRQVLRTRVSKVFLRVWAQIPTHHSRLRLQSLQRVNLGLFKELLKILLFLDNIFSNNTQIVSFPLFQSSKRIKTTKIKMFCASLDTLL